MDRAQLAATIANVATLHIVEDVVTSGGQVIASCEELRAVGGIVEHALCVIDREAGGREALEASGVELHALSRRRDPDEALRSVSGR